MNILKRPTLRELEYIHHVQIDWSHEMRWISRWDEICIYAIEHYGLPGKNYITDMSADRMIWSFRNPQNALMFKLRWSEVAC